MDDIFWKLADVLKSHLIFQSFFILVYQGTSGSILK